MKSLFKVIIPCILYLSTSTVYASEDIEKLLSDFNQKNDLSQKTIDQNKGHLLLYTRDTLERMHAKTLKDVLKTIPILPYTENRYGLTDPLAPGGVFPYSSNMIRLYIDDVEITQGWMGSGLLQYGDINIDFVDHIELYAIPPSFDTSIEPAYMTIFIYSKVPERDSGGKLSLIQASRGSNTQTIGYGDKVSGESFMINLSHTKENRENVPNGTDTPLSRDFERTQIFAYVKNENQMFHLQLIQKKSDTLAGLSYDATPLLSKMDNINLHLDYSLKFSEHWKAQLAYDHLKTDLWQEDDIPLLIAGGLFNNTLNTVTKNSTYSAELTYKNILDKHHIAMGTKGRIKSLDSLYIQKIGSVPSAFNKESILSVFMQDQYELSENELITLGLKYSYVTRNATYKDDNLFQLRLGYLYTNEVWSYKTYLFRNMFTIDPFSRYFSLNPGQDIEPQTTVGLTQELAYHSKRNEIRLMTFFLKEKNNFIDVNNIVDTKSFVSIINDDYTLDTSNKVSVQFAYVHYFDVSNIGDINGYNAYLMLSNTYDDFSIYNGLVWNYDSYYETHHYDWTSSISWDISEDLTFTLKGENLLNKAQTYNIFRINPFDGNFMAPLTLSSFDQRVSIEVEYTF
jgi:iron complex outermembrane receptor protein